MTPAAGERRYFVLTSSGEIGPYRPDVLKEMLAKGTIRAEDGIRNAWGKSEGTVADVVGTRRRSTTDPGFRRGQKTSQAMRPVATPVDPAQPVRRTPPSRHIPALIVGGVVAILAVLVVVTVTRNQAAAKIPPPAAKPAPSNDGAAVAVYEGFAYGGDNELFSSSEGRGWMGAWSKGSISLAPAIPFPGMTIASHAVSVRSSDRPAWSTRRLAAPITLGTTWVSCLIDNHSPQNNGAYLGLSLADMHGLQMWIGLTGHGDWGLERHAPPDFSEWRIVQPNPTDKPTLLLARIEIDGEMARCRLWCNPALGQVPPEQSGAGRAVPGFTFDRIQIACGGGAIGSIGEIRIGTSALEVLPSAH